MARAGWCATCRPTGTRCETCEGNRLANNAARAESRARILADPVKGPLERQRVTEAKRKSYAAKAALGLTRAGKEKPKKQPSVWRCDECRPAKQQCKSCKNRHRNAWYSARMASDPEFAAREREIARIKRQRARDVKRGDAERGTPGPRRTVARCENCPPKGLPCRPCHLAQVRRLYAARNPGVTPRGPRYGHVPKVQEPRPPRQPKVKAERRPAVMKVTIVTKEPRPVAPKTATPSAPAPERDRLPTCGFCMRRHRGDGYYCGEACEERARFPAGWPGNRTRPRAAAGGQA